MKRKERAKWMRTASAVDFKQRLHEIYLEIMRYKAVANSGGEALIQLPTGKMGGVKWGIYQNLKRERAQLLTITKIRGIKL